MDEIPERPRNCIAQLLFARHAIGCLLHSPLVEGVFGLSKEEAEERVKRKVKSLIGAFAIRTMSFLISSGSIVTRRSFAA